MNRSILILLAFAVALAGCAEKTTTPPANDDDGGAASDGTTDGTGEEAPREATFTAAEYAFTGPGAVSAGWVTFTLDNVGSEWHEMVILPLPEGKTLADFKALIEGDMGGDENASGTENDADENGEADFEEAPPVGGVGAIVGGAESTATVKLTEGEYVLACWIPAPDGMPHAFKGMLAELNVTAAAPNEEPKGADASITVADGNATIDPAFTAGSHKVKAVNTGTDPEADYSGLQFVKLDENVTAEDFVAYFENRSNATGPPPGRPWGGLTSLPAGATAYFDVDLVPGNYGIFSIDERFRVIAKFTVA